MKKYISILSLVTVVIMQSCDRSDLFADPETQVLSEQAIVGKVLVAKPENNNDEDSSNKDNLETGDDEPRKDKSHWRIKNDTVRK